jgi:hypothetical protein
LSGTPFRASPGLALFLVCSHAAAGAAAWISIPGAAGLAIAVLAMAAGAVATHGRALLLAPDSPSSLAFSAAGELRIVDRIGRDWAPVAHAPRYVSRWLVILPASGPAGRVRRLLVTRDMLPAEPFRRLRIWALWGGAAQSAAN